MADINNIYNSSFYEYLNPSQNRYGNLELIVTPTTQVVTTPELKSQLRIDTSDEDTLLATYISAATQMAENYCNRHFISHRYRVWFNELPKKFSLYYPDVVLNFDDTVLPSVNNDGLFYFNTQSNDFATLGTVNYYVNYNENPCTFKKSNQYSEPTYVIDSSNLVGSQTGVWYFQYTTGFGDAASDVPDAIKQAIKLIASDMYYFREDRKRAFPMASEILLQPYKCYL